MTTYDIWVSIRTHGKNAWISINPSGTNAWKLDVQLLSQSGSTTYEVVNAQSQAMETTLKGYAALIRKVLVDEVPSFANPFVQITVFTEWNGTLPFGPQYPPWPPTIIPKLPPTTPTTTGDRIYYV